MVSATHHQEPEDSSLHDYTWKPSSIINLRPLLWSNKQRPNSRDILRAKLPAWTELLLARSDEAAWRRHLVHAAASVNLVRHGHPQLPVLDPPNQSLLLLREVQARQQGCNHHPLQRSKQSQLAVVPANRWNLPVHAVPGWQADRVRQPCRQTSWLPVVQQLWSPHVASHLQVNELDCRTVLWMVGHKVFCSLGRCESENLRHVPDSCHHRWPRKSHIYL